MSNPISPKSEQALLVNAASLAPIRDAVNLEKYVKPIQTDLAHCWNCKRKVGLLGFKCKCSYIFCSKHRHSDQHDCEYDFKMEHREKLIKENPKIETPKIVKL